MPVRDPLSPAVAAVRLAARRALTDAGIDRAVVALSGGADSLALAAAVAFEAPRLGIAVTAVTVDHGLQGGSADVAARAASQARELGLDAEVARVVVGEAGGPEAAAREARYGALARVARERDAGAVLIAHTLDDQAESVLLGLARGSGTASLKAMAPARVGGGIRWIRPLLGVRRAQTLDACRAEALEPWHDPHNADAAYARVRVRQRVLPVLEVELGPGVAEALARTAEQLREDDDAFAQLIDEVIEDVVEHAEAGIAISVRALQANPAALRHRIIRLVVSSEFGASLTRAQTFEVARLATDWHGQGPIDLPGCRARREGDRVVVQAAG
ncbi:tRNA lysidine(34) synthetase TilS [Microbacterium sp. LRZ72]|uniref:tRNA lysidine(34) synthetase TilS n=1 Tax=Microbacterium sp. LRZ72 TaxID=2942481 RepID=UPI0029B7E0AA|nr:tRNA lysidine(34) synthetase TilS [Microbacterium sp. LRZ72]MDX2377839.1 tRNA lysidine(34) synthetase TilS [Microbacterium sp. LRZ72]